MPTRASKILSLLVAQLALGGGVHAEADPYRLQLPQRNDYRLHSAETAASGEMHAALDRKPHAREIRAAAIASRLDPALVHALIHVESRHRKDAVSAKGAVGLMQVLPATALRFGVESPTQVRGNLRAGTRYLRLLLDRYDQRLDLALSAYNAGEGAVARYGGIPPYAETQRYVPAVLSTYRQWRTPAQPQENMLAGNAGPERSIQ